MLDTKVGRASPAPYTGEESESEENQMRRKPKAKNTG